MMLNLLIILYSPTFEKREVEASSTFMTKCIHILFAFSSTDVIVNVNKFTQNIKKKLL